VAVLNGVRRGLFSNEAGMGTNANAAATATVRHPVQQGLIQSLGVFVDTVLVCSATAFIILAAGPGVYTPGTTTEEQAGALTTVAVTDQLGAWMAWPMSVIVFVLAFSSILGAYAYAEVNLAFLRGRPGGSRVLAAVTVVAAGVGAMATLSTVFALMDLAMALITVLNLAAILALGRWVVAALRDYEAAAEDGGEPRLLGVGNPRLPRDLDAEAWPGH
ncbi:alanine:cation symporter family protein, partial [Georgenia sp. 10Sc9-8]|nr:alanine:cation symporter family protein [Georgenia halotolerans]